VLLVFIYIAQAQTQMRCAGSWHQKHQIINGRWLTHSLSIKADCSTPVGHSSCRSITFSCVEQTADEDWLIVESVMSTTRSDKPQQVVGSIECLDSPQNDLLLLEFSASRRSQLRNIHIFALCTLHCFLVCVFKLYLAVGHHQSTSETCFFPVICFFYG